MVKCVYLFCILFFKQKTAYDMRISDWSSDVCSSDLCEVIVVQDGHRRSFFIDKNQDSVLDSALAQGIELPYSCKGGVCSTCRCKVIEGEVDMEDRQSGV